MIKEVQEKINFSIPLEISKGIVNADADVIGDNPEDYDVNSMYIEGLASTPKTDLQNQVLKPSGFVLDYFKKSGFINWNHQGGISPDAIIGEPVDMKVTNDNFYIKGKLYSWSNLAKSVYEIGLNLEKDKDSDRTLGFSVEGITLETKDNLVSKMLVTNVAVCFSPINNDTYCKIVKGITLDEVKDLRKSYVFKPTYVENVNGVKNKYILKLDIGEKQLLVDTNMDFHYRNNPSIFKISSMEDIRKAICTLATGYKEGFIKKNKRDELIKIIKDKKDLLLSKNN